MTNIVMPTTNKTFEGDLQVFKGLLQAHIPFTFSKYADGEWKILTDKPHDSTQRHNGEFKYDPKNEQDRKRRDSLLASFKYQSENYIVGISCPCCRGADTFNLMRQVSGQPADKLTWANMWVNANYDRYRAEVIPLFRTYEQIHLVCNNKAVLSELPFTVTADYRVGTNAWTEDFALAKTLGRTETVKTTRGALFLFCAGPLGNLLAWQLNMQNPANTYLDVGSTLDPWLFPGSQGLTRSYLRGGAPARRTCVWIP